MIAGCLSLQRLGVGLPVTRPAWDSNLGPPASEFGSLTTRLSVQLPELLKNPLLLLRVMVDLVVGRLALGADRLQFRNAVVQQYKIVVKFHKHILIRRQRLKVIIV